MTTFVYDGSFDGFLCAAGRALGVDARGRRLPDAAVDAVPDAVANAVPDAGPSAPDPATARIAAVGGGEADLFSRRVDVITDPAEADALREALRDRGGEAEIETLLHVHASADPRAPSLLLHYIAAALRARGPVGSRLTDPRILAVRKLYEKVRLEINRFMGFLRFRRAAENLWYAPVNPNADIVGFLGPHFADRFCGQSFLIHDVRRDTAFWHSGGACGLAVLSDMPEALRERLRRDVEPEITGLWKEYFRRIAVPQRRNPRQQARLLPRRYRPLLTETEDG